jgi:hypothetical protein
MIAELEELSTGAGNSSASKRCSEKVAAVQYEYEILKGCKLGLVDRISRGIEAS